LTVRIDPLYHWSPRKYRKGIIRRGLLPTCPTATTLSFADLLEAYGPGKQATHYEVEDDVVSFKAVCLGVSPAHAWLLSGACDFRPGSRWDLWQVRLDDEDKVFPDPHLGAQVYEIRVGNRIPKSRVWHVGTRVQGPQRWSHA
jgi:hypothetical protein